MSRLDLSELKPVGEFVVTSDVLYNKVLAEALRAQRSEDEKDATIKRLSDAIAYYGECYAGTELDAARSENIKLRERVLVLEEWSKELHRLLSYYREFMPFCVGMSPEEYGKTQEAINVDKALAGGKEEV